MTRETSWTRRLPPEAFYLATAAVILVLAWLFASLALAILVTAVIGGVILLVAIPWLLWSIR